LHYFFPLIYASFPFNFIEIFIWLLIRVDQKLRFCLYYWVHLIIGFRNNVMQIGEQKNFLWIWSWHHVLGFWRFYICKRSEGFYALCWVWVSRDGNLWFFAGEVGELEGIVRFAQVVNHLHKIATKFEHVRMTLHNFNVKASKCFYVLFEILLVHSLIFIIL
jgi:hypothetical protein